MKKNVILLTALGLALSASAQIANVSAPVRLFPAGSGMMCNPALSADGRTVMVSDPNFTNPRIINIASRSVAETTASTIEAANANFTAVRGNVEVSTEGSVLTITRDGHSAQYTPVPSEAGYLWASVSPDAQKVMFFAAGSGIVICDLDGNVLSRPGKFEAPVWYGNDYILAQNATDDGHQYSSSQIVLVSVDGSRMQELTAPESMSMTPSGAFDSNTVVYSTIDGLLYKMNVYIR